MVNLFFSYSHRDQDLRGSEYCYSVEMARALEKHAEGTARVIPVILRPCDWHSLPFGKLLAATRDGKPVTKYPDLHEAFTEVGLEVRRSVEALGKTKGASAGKHHPTPDSQPKSPVTFRTPRSSNLRVKREFTEREKDAFHEEAIEFISNFFEGSLKELEQRNKDIETKFRKVDANTFTAAIYRAGKKISACRIWLSNRSMFGDGLAYSSDDSSRGNSMNENLTLVEGTTRLALRSTMSFGNGPGEELTMEGGAEYYWAKLVEPLQGRD